MLYVIFKVPNVQMFSIDWLLIEIRLLDYHKLIISWELSQYLLWFFKILYIYSKFLNVPFFLLTGGI